MSTEAENIYGSAIALWIKSPSMSCNSMRSRLKKQRGGKGKNHVCHARDSMGGS